MRARMSTIATAAAANKQFYACANQTLVWELLPPETDRILAQCDARVLADPEFCLYGYRFTLQGTAAGERFSVYRVMRDADEQVAPAILWRQLQTEPGTGVMEVRHLSAPPSPEITRMLPGLFRPPCLEEVPPWLEAALTGRIET